MGGLVRLGGWLAGLIPFVAELLASWLGKRAALAVAVGMVYLGLVATVWAAISALIAGLIVTAPSGGLFQSFWMGFFLFLPSNWIPCAAACLSADVAVWLYRFHANRIAPAATGV